MVYWLRLKGFNVGLRPTYSFKALAYVQSVNNLESEQSTISGCFVCLRVQQLIDKGKLCFLALGSGARFGVLGASRLGARELRNS